MRFPLLALAFAVLPLALAERKDADLAGNLCRPVATWESEGKSRRFAPLAGIFSGGGRFPPQTVKFHVIKVTNREPDIIGSSITNKNTRLRVTLRLDDGKVYKSEIFKSEMREEYFFSDSVLQVNDWGIGPTLGVVGKGIGNHYKDVVGCENWPESLKPLGAWVGMLNKHIRNGKFEVTHKNKDGSGVRVVEMELSKENILTLKDADIEFEVGYESEEEAMVRYERNLNDDVLFRKAQEQSIFDASKKGKGNYNDRGFDMEDDAAQKFFEEQQSQYVTMVPRGKVEAERKRQATLATVDEESPH